jgi:hypothetical protein
MKSLASDVCQRSGAWPGGLAAPSGFERRLQGNKGEIAVMMRSLRFCAAVVLASPLALAGCGGSDAPPEITATTTQTVQNKKALPAHDSQIRRLDELQLRSLFSGRRINGLSPDGRKWTATFDASGAANIAWRGPDGGGRDTGSWEIEGDANCVTWQTLTNGEENCMTVYKVDEGQYNLFNDNGSMNSLITVPEL